MSRRLDPAAAAAIGAAIGAAAGVDLPFEHGAAIRPYSHGAAAAAIGRAGVDNGARVDGRVARVAHARIGAVRAAADLDRAAARWTASVDARGAGDGHGPAGEGSGA